MEVSRHDSKVIVTVTLATTRLQLLVSKSLSARLKYFIRENINKRTCELRCRLLLEASRAGPETSLSQFLCSQPPFAAVFDPVPRACVHVCMCVCVCVREREIDR
jgi:hypothetical protein